MFGDAIANDFLMLIKLDADTMAFASLLVSIVGALAAIFAAFYANIAAFYAKKAATMRDQTRVVHNTQHVEHFSNDLLSLGIPRHPQEKQEDLQAPVQQESSQPRAERRISPAQQEIAHVQAQRETPPAQAQREVSQPQVERKVPPAQQKVPQVQAQQEASQAQPQRIPISVEGESMGEAQLELSLTLRDSSIRISRVETLSGNGKILGSSPCKPTDNALVFKTLLAPERVSKWWDAGGSTSEGEAESVLRVYLLMGESRSEIYRDMSVSIVRGLRNIGIATLVTWAIKGSM